MYWKSESPVALTSVERRLLEKFVVGFHGTCCEPVEAIRKSGLTKRSAYRAFERLVRLGLVDVDHTSVGASDGIAWRTGLGDLSLGMVISITASHPEAGGPPFLTVSRPPSLRESYDHPDRYISKDWLETGKFRQFGIYYVSDLFEELIDGGGPHAGINIVYRHRDGRSSPVCYLPEVWEVEQFRSPTPRVPEQFAWQKVRRRKVRRFGQRKRRLLETFKRERDQVVETMTLDDVFKRIQQLAAEDGLSVPLDY